MLATRRRCHSVLPTIRPERAKFVACQLRIVLRFAIDAMSAHVRAAKAEESMSASQGSCEIGSDPLAAGPRTLKGNVAHCEFRYMEICASVALCTCRLNRSRLN